jgi:L-fucose mutarotase/ribose pyranase (RbsD/FucU family)
VIKKTSRNVERWDVALERLLPLLGHRNWIVVADSAYPAQSNAGIETIATAADHLQVLKSTMSAIERSKHVHGNIYVDAEFEFVNEQDAPGVTRYRRELSRLIGDRDIRVIAHEQIIQRLDESAKLFRIVILKSTLTIPYSSIFFELDCGYWAREAEERLRQSMARPRTAGAKPAGTSKGVSRK